jgi:ABC-2 type transport system ATP-binding protein
MWISAVSDGEKLEALIEAQNLHKSFGETHAVDGLSLRVSSGEIYGLVGPDGAGKTTTIRLLCGALQPDRRSGSALAETDRDISTVIHVAGYDVTRQTEQARTHIGYLPQRFSLYEDLTVLENIRFFAEVRGLKAREWRPRCMEILGFVGLDAFTDRLAGQLSGGMKQKLGLAAALVHQPRLLLLDEPTTGVDPVTRQDFWQLIIRLVSRANHDQDEVAVLVSTPYMDEAARCSRVGFMRSGRLLLEGTPAELRLRLEERILELRGKPLSLLRQVAAADHGVEDAQMFGDRLHLRLLPGKTTEVERRLRQSIAAEGGEITMLRAVPPQLEDVFISLLEQ